MKRICALVIADLVEKRIGVQSTFRVLRPNFRQVIEEVPLVASEEKPDSRPRGVDLVVLQESKDLGNRVPRTKEVILLLGNAHDVSDAPMKLEVERDDEPALRH
jgi:hypothetical protein